MNNNNNNKRRYRVQSLSPNNLDKVVEMFSEFITDSEEVSITIPADPNPRPFGLAIREPYVIRRTHYYVAMSEQDIEKYRSLWGYRLMVEEEEITLHLTNDFLPKYEEDEDYWL